MIDRGWRLRFIPIWRNDLEYMRQAIAEIGRPVEVIEEFADLSQLLEAFRTCEVFVRQKLHPVVFASAVHVPAVMLAYHHKCFDFQRSLGRERLTIATDDVLAPDLVELVSEIVDDYEANRRQLSEAVLELRGRLLRCAADINQELAR